VAAERTREIIEGFLRHVESRDSEAVAACFTEDAHYRNMPGPPAIGKESIHQVFSKILGASEKVQWDVVTESYMPGIAWLERVDRFWINGIEYSVECNGVFLVDEEAGLITEVRDYLDIGVWREHAASSGLFG
tara:strand:+ start:119 stop:517 length:399 start_codon:yes stop_codon:yes gene_type:complete